MSNRRINKKVHSRFLGEFCIEASQDTKWVALLGKLAIGETLSTKDQGWPVDFAETFEEVNLDELSYQVERVTLADVPRQASCWWPADEEAHYFKLSPSEFPQTQLFMMMDCFDESECSH